MHASCASPWHCSAKHHILGACFSLMAPFRTRFSPCKMAYSAYVQRLIGRLYALRYCYIPTCRFTAQPFLVQAHTDKRSAIIHRPIFCLAVACNPHEVCSPGRWGRACALPRGGYSLSANSSTAIRSTPKASLSTLAFTRVKATRRTVGSHLAGHVLRGSIARFLKGAAILERCHCMRQR